MYQDDCHAKTPGGAHQRTELRCQEENFLQKGDTFNKDITRGKPFTSKSADLGKRAARMRLQN